jgi:hypothetical protein
LPIDGTYLLPLNSRSLYSDSVYSVIKTFNLYFGGILCL